MKGAPARAIQELAGHANLSTTQRYMHLSPAAIESAIRFLDQPVSDRVREDIGETGQVKREIQLFHGNNGGGGWSRTHVVRFSNRVIACFVAGYTSQ